MSEITANEALARLKARGMSTTHIVAEVKRLRDEDPALGLQEAVIALETGYHPEIRERERQIIAAYADLEAERDDARKQLEAIRAALAVALAIESSDDDPPTPAPWGEFCESGDWWIERQAPDGGPANLDVVCADTGAEMWNRQADIDLTIELRNALPALRAALGEEPRP